MAIDYDRPENDYYATPQLAAHRGLEVIAAHIAAPRSILEPAAGGRALLKPLRETWPEATIDARDVCLQPGDEGIVVPADFWLDDRPEYYDLVITNPPYGIAETFIWQGLSKLKKTGHLALLLRIGFFGPEERSELWRRHMPKWIFVLKQRPRFKGKGNDSQPSAWCVWDTKPRSSSTLEVI